MIAYYVSKAEDDCQFGLFLEVGSGGPRALQKVPKRALVRVDPLKKVLLRVSALLRVLKKVLKRVPPLKRGLKKLLLGVNH